MSSPISALNYGYYLSLLTSEYRLAPNMNAWLSANLLIAQDITNCLAGMSGNFDIDYAVGAQLDVIGIIVGVNRRVNFQPSGSVSPILDDATYRLLLKATIANNQWDGTIGSLYPIWSALFPGGHITIIDNQDMSATIVMTGTFSSIIQDLITHEYIVPKPEAVGYSYVFGSLPFFGFDREDAFIASFGVGKWS